MRLFFGVYQAAELIAGFILFHGFIRLFLNTGPLIRYLPVTFRVIGQGRPAGSVIHACESNRPAGLFAVGSG